MPHEVIEAPKAYLSFTQDELYDLADACSEVAIALIEVGEFDTTRKMLDLGDRLTTAADRLS